ncbi:MAG: M23 family metallopeptidase [Candidatus Aminicenantaceae bacterium]
MVNKSFSVIIIPHSKEKSKTITLNEKTIKILLGVCGILLVALIVFLVEFFSFFGLKWKYNKINDENVRQKQTITEYKVSVNKLQARIDYFESYVKKLNVMAGIPTPDALKEIGIGKREHGNNSEINSPNVPQDITISKMEAIAQRAEGIEKNLNTLVNFFEDQTTRLAFTPSIAPTRGYMSSPFGWRDDPFTGKRTFHYGIDIATQKGNPVISTADGIVVSTKYDKIGGNTIRISHNFGYQSIYCHLSKFLVKPGQKVKRGDVIGLVGRTGKCRGTHVHYEVIINNKSVNPYYYLLEE